MTIKVIMRLKGSKDNLIILEGASPATVIGYSLVTSHPNPTFCLHSPPSLVRPRSILSVKMNVMRLIRKQATFAINVTINDLFAIFRKSGLPSLFRTL